jgi:hypothetical protein
MTHSSCRNKRHFKAVASQYIVCAPGVSVSVLLTGYTWSIEIATTIHELEGQKTMLESDSEKLEVLFKEMIQMCLW